MEPSGRQRKMHDTIREVIDMIDEERIRDSQTDFV